MKQVWPHEFFRIDLDQLPTEGKQQEDMLPVNLGEHQLACDIHDYFSDEVLPLIVYDDWVFEAAATFASEYARDCFLNLRLGGREAYRTQQSLVEIKDRVSDFVARVAIAYPTLLPSELAMTKLSDFTKLMDINRLGRRHRLEAEALYERCKDHERLQVEVALRSMRDCYETTLPRVMYVIRRVMKVTLGLPPKPSDSTLASISDYMDWYERRVSSTHALYPVFGKLRSFYTVARNCASHHQGLTWKPESDQIILRDKRKVISVHVDQFMQRYRYLVVYLCDYGLRGILSAFCERERGPVTKMLVIEYSKTFPENFPAGEQVQVRLY
jgi:hypothetical protein